MNETNRTDRLDATLAKLMGEPVPEPLAQRVLARVREAARSPGPVPAHVPEVLTLRDAAAFLRISEEELAQILDELPLFELAGQLRIRTERLREWIEQRERTYQRNAFRTSALRITRSAWLEGVES